MSARQVKIYCPKCTWMPVQSSRWQCSCGGSWNTFDTGGVCPRCSRVWEDTQCLACHAWSPHSRWYHEFIGGFEKVEVERSEPAPARSVRPGRED